jgi:hypothetical protein
MASQTVVHSVPQSKPPALKEEPPKPKSTFLEWVRNGFRFPGKGVK